MLRAPTITGTVLVLSFHILCLSISRSLYLQSLSNSLAGMFWSVGMLMSMRRHVFSLKSLTIMSGRFAFIVLSVRMGKFYMICKSSNVGIGLLCHAGFYICLVLEPDTQTMDDQQFRCNYHRTYIYHQPHFLIY